MAYHLLQHDRTGAATLAQALQNALERVGHCSLCNNFSEDPVCSLCAADRRDPRLLCVVEMPTDLLMLEQTHSYQGMYFVLMGRLSPLDGIGPKEIHLSRLLKRAQDGIVEEVILATNYTVEGEATAHYASELLKARGLKVSRICLGTMTFGEQVAEADAHEGQRDRHLQRAVEVGHRARQADLQQHGQERLRHADRAGIGAPQAACGLAGHKQVAEGIVNDSGGRIVSRCPELTRPDLLQVAVELGDEGVPPARRDLAEDVVRNGEGVRHVLRVRVAGAPDPAAARALGKAIVNSPLLKTAVAGNDPNVGRLVAALGKEAGARGVPLDPSRARLTMGGEVIVEGGLFRLDPERAPARGCIQGAM